MDLCRPLKSIRRRRPPKSIHITRRIYYTWMEYYLQIISVDYILDLCHYFGLDLYMYLRYIKDYDADRRSQERRRRKVCELHTLKYSVQQFYVSALCVNITSCYNACVFKVWLIDGACPADINIRLGTIRTYELRIWITYRTYYHKKLKYSEYVINSPLKISVMGVCPADISTQWVRNNYKTWVACL